MKYIYISFEFKLENAPEWLNDFRRKYDDPLPFHITLKTISTTPVANLHKIDRFLSTLVSKCRPFDINFNKLYTGSPTSNGFCIMVKAEPNTALNDLQSEISGFLSRYCEFAKPEYKTFEKNFTPHITIGRHLKQEEYDEALKIFKDKDVELRAILDTLVLKIVDEPEIDSWNDPENHTVYKLQ